MKYVFTTLILLIFAAMAFSEPPPDALPAFLQDGNNAWICAKGVKVRSTALKSAKVVKSTVLGDPVKVISREGSWSKVTHISGKQGWVENRHLSTTWILVHKKLRRLMLMDGVDAKGKWIIDLASNYPAGDKEKSGDMKTPEGELYVCKYVPHSQFYKAFLLSYPSIQHADRGLKLKLINKAQHKQIVNAIKARRVPPQNTKLGNLIEIHGNGSAGKYDWTLGCIAVEDKVMDFLWKKVPLGTPVVVTP